MYVFVSPLFSLFPSGYRILTDINMYIIKYSLKIKLIETTNVFSKVFYLHLFIKSPKAFLFSLKNIQ